MNAISMTTRIRQFIECVKLFELACRLVAVRGGEVCDKPGRPSFEEQTSNYKENLAELSDIDHLELMQRAYLIRDEILETPYNKEYHELIKAWLEQEEHDLIKSVVLETKVIVDDHCNGRLGYLPTVAISKYTTPYGVIHTVPHTAGAHCLNRLYVAEDDLVHVSTSSVGGVIEYRHSKDLIKEIELFNQHDIEEERDFLKWGQLSDTTFI